MRHIAWVWVLIGTSVMAGENITGTLSGRVVSHEGKPVAGAKVTLPDYGDVPPLAETRTDDAGNFVLNVTEPASRPLHRRSSGILIEAEGFAANYVSDRQITLFADADKSLGTIRLFPGRSYHGRVVDQSGRPVVGANVECVAVRYEMGHTINYIGKKQTVTTDADGRYVTPRLPLGVPMLVVQADGFQQAYLAEPEFRDVPEDGACPELKLEPDFPLAGRVRDENGDPVVDIEVRASGVTTRTDADGKFVLKGFPKETDFQFQIFKDGYVGVNWGVEVKPDGIEYVEVNKYPDDDDLDAEAYKKALAALTVRLKELDIQLQREGLLTGRAVDAQSGDPVALQKIILCTFQRKPDGEIVLNGCRASRFEQPKPGEFRLGYTVPTEYHLTLVAEGYEDAEAFTPNLTQLINVDDIVVKMKRKAGAEPQPASFQQRISGVVVSEGSSREPSRVGLWQKRRPFNAINSWIIRGRTSTGDGVVYESQTLKDGRFSLDVPFQGSDWYVILETPQGIVGMEGPLEIAKGEHQQIELRPQKLGSIRGRVTNPKARPNEPLWVVAFSKLGVQYEAPVDEEGNFELNAILPGEYGLKTGCDAVRDRDVPTLNRRKQTLEERIALDKLPSKPWERATRVSVEGGQIVEGIELQFEP